MVNRCNKYKEIWLKHKDEIKYLYLNSDLTLVEIAKKFNMSTNAMVSYTGRNFGKRLHFKIKHKKYKTPSIIRQNALISARLKKWDAPRYKKPQAELPKSGQCKYPIGKGVPYKFCKNKATHGVYCEKHHKLCHRHTTKKFLNQIISYNNWLTRVKR